MMLEIFFSVVGIFITLVIAYFWDKKIIRPMWKDWGKKFSLSYNVDKYILKKDNLDVEFD